MVRQSRAMAFNSILIVGCGNMAGAMLRGWLRTGTTDLRFTVVDPANPAVPDGIPVSPTVPSDGEYDAILLGVKPQLLAEIAPQVAPLAGGRTVVISILAGVELAVLAEQFPDAAGLMRVMPNLSAALGKSPMAVAERGLDEQARRSAFALLAPLGTPEWVDETLFHVVTALAGSGPAFVYRFIDALGGAAAELGLSGEQAARLALATVEGATALALQSDASPNELARRVASPGGTTQAGLDVLDRGGRLRTLLTDTLRAARDRSVEMAAEARQKG
jgi:pyrroline-5-carboxylate reductase